MPRTPSKKDIPPSTRVAVVLFLAQRFVAGKLAHGSIKAAASKLSVSVRWVRDVWGLRNNTAALVAPRKPYIPRSTKIPPDDIIQRIAAVPLCERQSLRSLSHAFGIPTMTLSRYLSSSILRRQISRAKPALTQQHKIARLMFALGQIQRPIGKKVSYKITS